MSAHRIKRDLYRAPEQLDVGSGGTVRVDQSPYVMGIVSAAAEARTVADPTAAGAKLLLYHRTDGGDVTVTFSTAYNENGATTYVFSDPGQFAEFVSVYDSAAGAYYWRLVSNSEVGKAPAAAGATLAAVNTLTASDGGKTLFLNSATEFVTTLPAPALGLRFEFIVTAAPSGASYTIVTNGSANIIKGQVYSSDLNAASDGDIETAGADTISFVDSKSVAGDRVSLYCDGTNWFAYAFCSVFDAITFTTAS